MALQGKFLVNNAAFSPLTIFGVGTFPAFSGDGVYRNRGGCTKIADKGPIPAGRYWIVDRPTGGIRSRAWTWARDTTNSFLGMPSNHAEWFALYRDDGQFDNYTWLDELKRGNFRLHPMGGHGVSLGCITIQRYSDFQTIRRALLHTKIIPVRNTGLVAYGCIEVITYGNTCP